jgi:hypothetical protein
MREALKHNCEIEPPPSLFSEIITNFMSYFQLEYFHKNVADATLAKIALFNPSCNFHFPQFQLWPEFELNRVKEAKQAFANIIQGLSVKASKFQMELILIRIAKAILNFMTDYKVNESMKKIVFPKIFSIGYFIAKMEFSMVYPIKNVNWKERESKIRLTLPSWRKLNSPPPTKAYNNYAYDISRKIAKGEVNFSGESVELEYSTFLGQNKGQPSRTITNSHSIPNRRDKQHSNLNTSYRQHSNRVATQDRGNYHNNNHRYVPHRGNNYRKGPSRAPGGNPMRNRPLTNDIHTSNHLQNRGYRNNYSKWGRNDFNTHFKGNNYRDDRFGRFKPYNNHSHFNSDTRQRDFNTRRRNYNITEHTGQNHPTREGVGFNAPPHNNFHDVLNIF